MFVWCVCVVCECGCVCVWCVSVCVCVCVHLYDVHQFLDTFTKLQILTISFVMSFHLSICLSAWNNLTPTEQIFTKFDVSVFFETLSRKFKYD